MADRGMRHRAGARRLDRIEPGLAMGAHQLFGAGVIGLEGLVADRPGGRDAGLVLQRAEVLLAEAHRRRAEEFRVAADIVIGARREQFAVAVAPLLLGREFAAVEHGIDAPELRLAAKARATLQHQDVAPGRGEAVGKRAAADTSPDDHDVVAVLQLAHPRLLPRGRPSWQGRRSKCFTADLLVSVRTADRAA